MGIARDLAARAKGAATALCAYDDARLSASLRAMADALLRREDDILSVNPIDVDAARASGETEAFVERLTLYSRRIAGMADALREVAALPHDPGRIEYESLRSNGMHVVRRRVPFGVVGVIYESRPNVTSDAVGLCIKSGNACLLRGGSKALRTNLAVVRALQEGAGDLPPGAISAIDDPARRHVDEMLRLNGLVDLIIPRGGAELIQNVVDNATVPVLQTGVGVCHVFAEKSADFAMATEIIVNAKVSRPSVCNAAETLLVDAAIARAFLPGCAAALAEAGVVLRGDAAACGISDLIVPAHPDEWDTEHLALILGVRIVDGLDAAIEHIAAHGTNHSEAIVTQDAAAAAAFMARVDAAAVYHNASTRFTDGGEFGLGAEIGISNQKLHARGPVGIDQLSTTKYFIYGSGQIRGV